MKPLTRLVARGLGRIGQTIDAPLEKCVHFCAFRYGRQEYNPYETYQIELQQGASVVQVRRRFIEFLQHYRPRHFGEALSVRLSRPYALWAYPWHDSDPRRSEDRGWMRTPDDCPDIMTHFCEDGILSFRIEQEFFWLERALRTIGDQGYQPLKHAPAKVVEFRRSDGERRYLLVDGNHRAGALSALGCSRTIHALCDDVVREQDAHNWPAVRKNWMSREDALALFHAYFRGNPSWSRSATPASILAPPGWLDMYFR